MEFKGKNENSSIPATLYKKLSELFPPEKLATIFDSDTCLYGEGCGRGIQKGGELYVAEGVDFVLFDVRIGEFWLERNNLEDVSTKLNIKIVPIVYFGDNPYMTLDRCIHRVRDGFKSHWGDFKAEGLVMKPRIELFNRKGERIITKLKVKDFERLKSIK